MKTIAALIAGLLLSIATYFGGVLTSFVYFDSGKEQHRAVDTAALWTAEPVKVDKKNQAFRRLPARPLPDEPKAAGLNKAAVGGTPKDADALNTEAAADNPQMLVDPTTTGAIDPVQAQAALKPRMQQASAHIEWCSRHYRSYRPENNTYKPYSGGRRPCESPYSNTAAGDLQPGQVADDQSGPRRRLSPDNVNADESQADLEQASFDSEEGDYLTDDHLQSCLRRYNSYRPEDNSYQPFDGGPRRQCQ